MLQNKSVVLTHGVNADPRSILFSSFFRVTDLNAHNQSNTILTAKLLHQGYRYHKLRKTFFFQNFIVDTMNWFQTLRSVLNLYCNKAYRNQNFMVTWSTN